MRQIAYPAALGSCVLGAGAAQVRAAEWSITPVYTSSVDYDSNRSLARDGIKSEATVLAVDLKFRRALEDLEIIVEPRYAFRRYTEKAFGNGDDRSLDTRVNWVRERSTLNLSASYLDQSTLETEVLETGILNGDTHRRAEQAGATWSLNQTERRVFFAQLSYLDVSYHGVNEDVLPGYRYPSGSLGEQFIFSERGTFTLSAFGSTLQTDTKGNSSHEVGVQGEVNYLLSEKTKVDASLGTSRRSLSGQNSRGTVAGLTLDHSFELGKLSFIYKRSLVPYGFGFLSEQQQFNVTFSRPLTVYLDSSVAFYRVMNNETAVLLRLDRRNYSSVAASLTWHPVETWSLGVQLEDVRTETADITSMLVTKWRAGVTFTWAPFPKSRSW